MKKINYILSSLFFIVGVSCVNDELNLKLSEFDDVTIGGLEKIYNLELGENLRIEPTITTRFNSSEDDYEYLWYKYSLAITSKADTIGFAKILDVKIQNVQPGVLYYLTLKVINKKDKTFTLTKSELSISGEFSGGVMMLTKTGDALDLAFIKNGTKEMKNNLYSYANNGDKLPSTSNAIFFTNPIPPQPANYKRLLITTNDENLGYCLSHDGFKIIDKIKDKFLLTFPEVENHQIYTTFNSWSNEFLLIGGKLYDRMFPYTSDNNPLYNSEILCLTKPMDFELAPVILQSAATGGEPIVFDNKHGRFMYKTQNGISYSFFKNNKAQTNFLFFDPGKLAGKKLLCCGYYDDTLNNMWTLMDDTKTGDRIILAMSHSMVNYVATFKTLMNRIITREMAPNLYKAENVKSTSTALTPGSNPWVTLMEGISNAFVYIVDNKLYFYNIPSNYEYVIVDGNKEGFTIDDVFVNETSTINNKGEKEKFTRIALAIRDKNATEKKGGVAYYKVNFLGGVTALQYFKEIGFCDQVISLDEKDS